MNIRKILRILFAACAVVGGFWLIRMLWAEFLFMTIGSGVTLAVSDVYSVGIIGGADGPTSILVAGPEWPIWVLPGVMLAAGLLGLWRLRK